MCSSSKRLLENIFRYHDPSISIHLATWIFIPFLPSVPTQIKNNIPVIILSHISCDEKHFNISFSFETVSIPQFHMSFDQFSLQRLRFFVFTRNNPNQLKIFVVQSYWRNFRLYFWKCDRLIRACWVIIWNWLLSDAFVLTIFLWKSRVFVAWPFEAGFKVKSYFYFLKWIPKKTSFQR